MRCSRDFPWLIVAGLMPGTAMSRADPARSCALDCFVGVGLLQLGDERGAVGGGPDGASGDRRRMKILSCNSNRPLAEAISAYLGQPLTRASVRRFSDMEIFVEIHE